jgi:hypothetical protein
MQNLSADRIASRHFDGEGRRRHQYFHYLRIHSCAQSTQDYAEADCAGHVITTCEGTRHCWNAYTFIVELRSGRQRCRVYRVEPQKISLLCR